NNLTNALFFLFQTTLRVAYAFPTGKPRHNSKENIMTRALLQRCWLAAMPLLACLALSPAAHAFSLSDLFGGGDDKMEALADNPLASMLTDQLGVSTEQAAGGAGALLSMAASQL